MADYGQPDFVENRVRFFDGQYLQDQDFIDEQKYHVDRERRMSRLLRVTGVAEGLTVTPSGANQVTVAKGMAVDSLGRQLVLADDVTLRLPAAQFNNQQNVAVSIIYEETPVDVAATGSKGERRWSERPKIAAVGSGSALTVAPEGASTVWDGPTVLLARLRLDGNGAVTVDPSAAERAGIRLSGSVAIGTDNPSAQPSATLDVAGAGDKAGQVSLHVRSGNSAANYESNQITFGYHGGAQYRHAIKTRHHGGQRAGNAIDFYLWNYSTAAGAADAIGGLHSMTLDGGNVGIGTTSPGAKLDVRADTTTTSGWLEAIRLGRSEHSAITHPGGGLLFGMHSNRNFYFADTKTGTANHRMVISGETGNVGIGTATPTDRLQVSGGKLRLDGNQQVVFSDGDTTNNLKLQLWSGFGLGINGATLFYAANGQHSWRDNGGTNERMLLTTGADGALTVRGTGTSSFSGPLQLRRDASTSHIGSAWFLELYQDEWAPPRMQNVHPAIRFRHHNHFENTLEARPNAFHLLTGGSRDNYAELWSSKLFTRGLNIGSFGTGKVGTETSRAMIDIQDAARTGTHPASVRCMYLTADLGEASNGVEIRHSNASQGIGFGYNSLYAAGTNTDQHINLVPKGTGHVGIGTTSPGAKLDVRANTATTSGWAEAIRLSHPEHSAITYPGGGLLFGMHSNRNFYFADTKSGSVNYRMMINGETGWVGIGATSPAGKLTVNADTNHLALRREESRAGGGAKVFLELAQEDSTGGHAAVYPSILFHHGNQFWHRFEARRGGFHVKDGPDSEAYLDLTVRDLYATGHLFFEPRSNWGTEPNLSMRADGTPDRRYWYFRRDNWNLNNLGPGGVSVHASGVAYPSDARLKEHVSAIPDALDRIGRLRGVHFAWSAEGLRHLTRDIEATTTVGPDATPEENEQLWQELRGERCERLAGRKIGLLAQDVEQVAPELVHTDGEGFKSIDYSRLVAVLVEAVKELDARTKELTDA